MQYSKKGSHSKGFLQKHTNFANYGWSQFWTNFPLLDNYFRRFLTAKILSYWLTTWNVIIIILTYLFKEFFCTYSKYSVHELAMLRKAWCRFFAVFCNFWRLSDSLFLFSRNICKKERRICEMSSFRAYFFGHNLFSADAFSFQQTSKRIFLVLSSENGRFRRPPKPSVPQVGRFRRHRKKAHSPFKIYGIVRTFFDQPSIFGSCVFWCRKLFLLSLPFSEFGGSAKNRRLPKNKPLKS